jgi:hypothetical protein
MPRARLRLQNSIRKKNSETAMFFVFLSERYELVQVFAALTKYHLDEKIAQG